MTDVKVPRVTEHRVIRKTTFRVADCPDLFGKEGGTMWKVDVEQTDRGVFFRCHVRTGNGYQGRTWTNTVLLNFIGYDQRPMAPEWLKKLYHEAMKR